MLTEKSPRTVGIIHYCFFMVTARYKKFEELQGWQAKGLRCRQRPPIPFHQQGTTLKGTAERTAAQRLLQRGDGASLSRDRPSQPRACRARPFSEGRARPQPAGRSSRPLRRQEGQRRGSSRTAMAAERRPGRRAAVPESEGRLGPARGSRRPPARG